MVGLTMKQSGWLNRSFVNSKAALMRWVKVVEIALMAFAGIGWVTHHLVILIAAVVGMGLHSTMFGPIKHAYLPQHLSPDELVGGNGMVQMGTFVGILTGQLSGAMLVTSGQHGIAFIMVATVAVAGLMVALRRKSSHHARPLLTAGIAFGVSLLSAPLWYVLRGRFDEFWSGWWTYASFMSDGTGRGYMEQLGLGWNTMVDYYRERPESLLVVVAFVVVGLEQRVGRQCSEFVVGEAGQRQIVAFGLQLDQLAR